MRPDITLEIRFFRILCPGVRYTQTETKKAGGVHSKKECLFLPFPAYRAGKVLRLHFSNGEAAASGLVDTGNGHKGLGIDLRDQIAELV